LVLRSVIIWVCLTASIPTLPLCFRIYRETLSRFSCAASGTTDRCEEKAEKLAALLTQPGRTYDVSSPDLPTVK
ncbi:hypothetical protein ABLN72_12215, partial [Mycobacterium tuberculosis]